MNELEIKLLPSPEELVKRFGSEYVPDANGFVEQITPSLIQDLAETYKPDELHEAPIVIGHDSDPQYGVPNSDRLPAMGWVRKLFVRDGALYALAELTKLAKEWIKNKYYRYSSIGYYKDNSPNCPTPGRPYLRHLALLGAQPPAIKGLGPIEINFGEANIMAIIAPDQLDAMVKLIEEDEAVAPANAEAEAPAEQATESEMAEGEANAEQSADANAFLAENAGDILRYLLSEGEDGYKGEISEIDPEPSADNGWLWDDDKQRFAGKFVDRSLGEPQVFEFVLAKQGDSWERSYKPESNNIDALEQPEEEIPAEPAPASAEQAGQGEAISQMSEADILRQQLAIANAKLAEMQKAELNRFTEQLYAEGKLTEGIFPQRDLVALLQFAEQASANAVVAFSEGQASPVDKLKTLLTNLPVQVHFGETAYASKKLEKDEEEQAPAGTIFEGRELNARVKQYCEENMLDPKKPADYKKALRAVSS